MTDILTAGRPGDEAPDDVVEDDLLETTADEGAGWLGSRWARLRAMPAEGWITFGVVAVCVGFTLSHLQPSLLIADTTPAGGDMGAHVWGPAYLRDHLLAHGRLTGWTPDWYAGFPAYHFYMVVPSLMILALDLVLPYGVAFKLITVAGVLTLPVAGWAFGRLSGLRFPGPAMFSVATLPFLFDQGFTIYGGNIASTLAGEFAFSISLSVALLYLGVVARGLETGRHRALAAVLLGLCALCHLIPAIFALVGTVVWLLLRPGRPQVRWVATMAPVGALVASFWVLPFYLRRAYLNDMGWEKLTEYWINLVPADNRWLWVFPIVGAIFAIVRRSRTGIWLVLMVGAFAVGFVVAPQGRLWNARLLPFYFLCLYLLGGYAIAEAGKAIGRIVGVTSSPAPSPGSADPVAGLDRSMPAAESVPGAERDADQEGRTTSAPASVRDVGPSTILAPERAVRLFTPLVGLVFVVILVALPLHALPFGRTGSDGVYRWMGLHTSDRSFVDGWARWNYSGYERKQANASGGGYPEYYDLMQTMAQVGVEQGCGRAMWEYEKELDRYGTPMAPMLLPHWTDGCIGSMEGLYFEASSTTPYHFLNQSELSTAPSRAQRDLPYRNFDIDAGISHLQLLGVRYYLAFSTQAVDAAEQHPDLTEVATSGPWHVYEIAGSELVTPLTNQPAVLEGVSDAIHSWLPPSVAWYQDSSQWDVPLASDGPADWPRVEEGETPERVPVEPAAISSIEAGDDSLSFEVDQVGSPVLVKVSYFPNWQASGADGPYRVTPNLMVVVPTETRVELRYGYTNVDRLAWVLTLAGLVGLVLLARRPPIDMARRREAEGTEGDELRRDGDDPADGLDGSARRPAGPVVDDPDRVLAPWPHTSASDPGPVDVDPGAVDPAP